MRWCVQCGWYWGAIGWEEAEKQLATERDGSFLLRDSSDDRYLFSLSFRALDTTHHTRIEHYKGQLLLLPAVVVMMMMMLMMKLSSMTVVTGRMRAAHTPIFKLEAVSIAEPLQNWQHVQNY